MCVFPPSTRHSIAIAFFASLVQMSPALPTSSATLRLRGGMGNFQNPSRPLSALKQSDLQPDDLWPSAPPPGHLNREHQGYSKDSFQPSTDRIPNVLHRVVFLGTQRDISEGDFEKLMDETMLHAYNSWKDQNRASGFRFELYNLARAERYIEQHFESKVLRAFQTLQPYAYKSDLFRYLVLYTEGGWYVDLKLGMASESPLALPTLLDRLAAELGMHPGAVGFVGTGQNMVWNVPGAEGAMNAFLGAKAGHPALGDTIVRVVDAIEARSKGSTPWSLTGPYALLVGIGKRKGDHKAWRDFQLGEDGVALMRFGFDEWHLPSSDSVVLRKASRGECGGGWGRIGGNNYVDLWFADAVFHDAHAAPSPPPL